MELRCLAQDSLPTSLRKHWTDCGFHGRMGLSYWELGDEIRAAAEIWKLTCKGTPRGGPSRECEMSSLQHS